MEHFCIYIVYQRKYEQKKPCTCQFQELKKHHEAPPRLEQTIYENVESMGFESSPRPPRSQEMHVQHEQEEDGRVGEGSYGEKVEFMGCTK